MVDKKAGKAITMRRVIADRDGNWIDATNPAEGFALFSDGTYTLAIDPLFRNLNDKVGVILDAFMVKGGSSKKKDELAAEIFAAIAQEGGA